MASIRTSLLATLLLGFVALPAPPPLFADLGISEWVITKGNTIEVLGPDASVDLQQIIDDILDASDTNRYQILLGPGVYELGSGDILRLKEYVDLSGSGQETTEILGSRTSGGGSCGSGAGHGVVATTDNSVLSDLTVTNDSTVNSTGYCLCNSPGTSPTIRRVTAKTISDSGGGSRHVIHLDGGSPHLIDVTSIGESGNNVYGLYCSSGTPLVSRAWITVRNGVSRNRGIWMVGSCELEMTDLTLTTEESPINQGIDQQTGTEIDLARARLRLTGTGDNTGINVTGDGVLTLTDVRVRPTGGSSNTGIEVNDSALLRMFRSTASGNSGAIVHDSTTDGYVSQSTIFSDVSGTGDVTCLASDNGNGDPLEADCQVAP